MEPEEWPPPDISRLERLKRPSGSVRTLSDDGLTADCSPPSDPQVESDSTTSLNTSSNSDLDLLKKVPKRRKKSNESATAESAPKVRKTTSKGRSNTCNESTQSTGSSKTSAPESTSKGKDFARLWSSQPKDWYQKLWLPIETDSVVSPLNSLSGSFTSMESNSWCSMKRWTPQSKESWSKTSLPSSTFSIVESTVKESMTREKKVPKARKVKGLMKSTKPVSNYCRKIRLFPNPEVAGKLRQWFGCCRKTYNWALDRIKHQEEGEKSPINLVELRKRFVNAESVPDSMKYLLECPKHVRDGALVDLVGAFSTNFKKRAKNPDHTFDIHFRSKKENQSIAIPGASLEDRQTVKMFPTFLKNRIRYQMRMRDKRLGKSIGEIGYDCRMQLDKLGRFYLCIPMVRALEYGGACDSQTSTNSYKLPWVAMDPGVRTFQTLYSPEKGVAYKVGDGDMTRIFRLCKHLDKLISKANRRRRFEKTIYRLRKRIQDLVNDVHWKTIAFLLSNFQKILIPVFEVSRMVKRSERRIGKESVRKMLTWRHYVFRQRLMEKSMFTDSDVFVIGEEYTTKTCGNCFQLHTQIGGRKVFHCPHCNVKIERDVNASRNIFLKNVSI